MLLNLAGILLASWLVGVVGTFGVGVLFRFLLVNVVVIFLLFLVSSRRPAV